MDGLTRDGVYSAAVRLVACGLSVIPIAADGSKGPLCSWKTYQARRPSEDELRAWFCGAGPVGIAVVGGAVSGGLLLLDFDEPGLYSAFESDCRDQGLGDLLEQLPRAITPSGGRHVYFRAEGDPIGNRKLAYTRDRKIRIETRGEGGYALIPPSPAACHAAGVPYLYERLHLALVPTITAAEADELLAMAQTFNEWCPPEKVTRETKPRPDGALRPGDDYNARAPWEPLLTEIGLVLKGTRGEIQDWGWADAPRKMAATVNHGGTDLLYMFSSNAHPFEAETSYSKFAVYALLRHGGDYAAAARQLGREGWGDQTPIAPPERPPHPADTWEEPTAGSTAGTKSDNMALEAKEPEDDPDDPKGPALLFTDLGNARRLIRAHGRNLRYCHAWEQWLIWDGCRWAPDTTGGVQRLMRGVVETLHREAEAEPDEDKRKALRSWATRSESLARLTAAVATAQDEDGVPLTVEAMDQHPMLLAVQNGTLDLTTGKLRRHDRADYLTKIVPVVYDPDACCPRWEKFLERIHAGNTETIQFLQRAVGFALTGDTRRRHMIILYGKGRNGKSTFLDTLHTLMGDYALTMPAEALMVRQSGSSAAQDLARLRGARFVQAGESEEGARLAAGLVKMVTGDDVINARMLYQNAFDFKPAFKLFLATNHQPRMSGTDEGLWDRVRFVPFAVRIPDEEKDETLPAKLLAELPGILAWAVRGCLDWQKNGLGYPAAIEDATSEYRREMDSIGRFLSDRCAPLPNVETPATDLYRAYVSWAEEGGEYIQKQTSFGRSLTDRGFVSKNRGGKVYRIGIGLTDDSSPPPPPAPYQRSFHDSYDSS